MQARAAQGARRATGAALACVRYSSSRGVFIFFQRLAFYLNNQFSQSDIHRSNHILIRCLGRQSEFFSENVQHPVTANEANQMVPPSVGFGQWMAWSAQRAGKANFQITSLQSGLWRLSFQFAVAVARIVLVFKSQRFSTQLSFAPHHNSPEKSCLKVVIELFDDTIPPRFCHRNKPRLNVVEQTQTNQDPHPSRILPAAVEDQLVVNLNVLGNSQTAPTRPDRVESVLPSFPQHWTDRTASSGQIDAVQTVEANRTFQKTWAHIVYLMDFIHRLTRELRIFPALRFIAPDSAMRQFLPTQNPVDGSQRRQRVNSQLLQLPLNGLGTTEQSLVIQVQPHQLYRFDSFVRNLTRVAARTLRSILCPLRALLSFLMPLNPLVDPTWRVPHGTRYCRNRLSSPARILSSTTSFPIDGSFPNAIDG
jgi:hypothetical protein